MKPFLQYLLFLIILSPLLSMGQNSTDYYYQIPSYPSEYTSETVAARLVDGLGFRFYWATADLRPEDYAYKASPEGRTLEEAVGHIMGLTHVLLNAVEDKPNTGGDRTQLKFEEKRAKALENIQLASEIL